MISIDLNELRSEDVCVWEGGSGSCYLGELWWATEGLQFSLDLVRACFDWHTGDVEPEGEQTFFPLEESR